MIKRDIDIGPLSTWATSNRINHEEYIIKSVIINHLGEDNIKYITPSVAVRDLT